MNPDHGAQGRAHQPTVWLLLGDKLGDNAQVELITESLNWPYQRKQLYFKSPYILGKPAFKASLYHLDQRSDVLAPPWPDLILTIGRRPSMAALWIRQQSPTSKIVLIGRPKRSLRDFDLIIAPGQYHLPHAANVLPIELPLMRSPMPAIEQAITTQQAAFADLPRPLTALLIGGPTKPFRFDAAVVSDLMTQAQSVVNNGTLYITTSRRTPPAVVMALQKYLATHLPKHTLFYRWQPNDASNPYHALLGFADQFIVTGDSISMLVEVARLGKPLAIFPLPMQSSVGYAIRHRMTHLLNALPLGEWLYQTGWFGFTRDLTAFHQRLIQQRFAVWLGNPFLSTGCKAPDELPIVVDRIKQLF